MPNITVRQLTTDDFPLFYKWWNDRELRELTSDQYEPIEELETNTILAEHLDEENHFDYIIELESTPIGHILIEKLKQHRAKFYIAIGEKSAWGKGYGTTAILLSIENYLIKYPNTTFELEVNQDNPRAIRAYEKAGFVRVGEKHYRDAKSTFAMQKLVG